MRTFADWNDPAPGSMEMDLVAHCGSVNRGSYVHSLVLTDIASGWTEAAPIVVREGSLVVETLERIRAGLPFALRALDVDNGSEFVNDRLIEYCLSHGIELTRSRPYRKNDQAWIEQKNGAVVRKLLGLSTLRGTGGRPGDHTSLRGLAAVRELLPAVVQAGRQATRRRQGDQALSPAADALRATSAGRQHSDGRQEQVARDLGKLDPLKLLEEMRAVQAYLAALADGDSTPPMSSEPPNLAAFVASLSSAWHMGEIRPTFSADAKPRYLRSLERIPARSGLPLPLRHFRCRHPTSPHLSRRRSCKPSTPSLAKPGSRRFAWYGQSSAGDLKASPTSTRCSSSTNCASSFQADSPQGNTRRCCGGSTCGVEMHLRGAS